MALIQTMREKLFLYLDNFKKGLKMRKAKVRLFIDQYGYKYYASTLKELKEKHYLKGKISKMYVDRKDKVYHIGYVIGQNWLTEFSPVEKEI